MVIRCKRKRSEESCVHDPAAPLSGEIDAIVHMGDHAYNYGDANGSRADAYLDGRP